MDYKFITIDGYQILVDNKRGFMNLTDIAKMLNCEVEKIKDPLNVSANSKIYTDTMELTHRQELSRRAKMI